MQEFIKRNGQFTVNIGLCEGWVGFRLMHVAYKLKHIYLSL